jgi:hypothetical protein
MAIDRIPGVGPQNTDIASAVVTAGTSAGFAATGPTTTQIAAAVPTLAQITSAVTSNAASAGVTMAAITSSITTNAASAGVTLAAIGTQVANNSPSANNWTVIANSGINWSNFTFTGISGYRKLRLFAPRLEAASGAGVFVRVNSNGTVGNYFNSRTQTFNGTPGGTTSGSQDSIQFGISADITPGTFDLIFEFANLATISKTITGRFAQNQSSFTAIGEAYRGYFVPTAAITSLQIFSGGTLIAGQPVYLLGQN